MHLNSLILVSLPRSLSTQTYHLLRAGLGLAQPTWTSDGEILNLDRHCLFPKAKGRESRKFVEPRLEPERFRQAVDFLRVATLAKGFIYKDVVQPFAVADWLPGSGLNVVRIERRLADVAYAMIEKRWYYPGNAASLEEDTEGALIEGLVRAGQALDLLPATRLEYDELTVEEAALWEPLQRLYPEAAIDRRSYLDSAFREALAERVRRRDTRRYREIEARCEEIRARLEG